MFSECYDVNTSWKNVDFQLFFIKLMLLSGVLYRQERKMYQNMGKENQRTRLTKKLLKDALITLMQNKPVSKTTIKEICEVAELNRSTFYLHYTDQYQLLEDIENDILKNTADHMENFRKNSETQIYLSAFFQYIKDHRQIFRILLVDHDTYEFQAKLTEQTLYYLRELCGNPQTDARTKYLYIYLMQGSSSILKEWIRSDFDVSAEELALYCTKFVKQTLEVLY